MSLILKLLLATSIFLLISCSNKEPKISQIKEVGLDQQMIEAYKEGLELLDIDQGLMAAKKFNEAEILYPQSIWAPRASLMSAYSYYYFDSYSQAIQEIDRYLKKYPNHQNKDYAFYLKSVSYYNQISNEKKDLGPIVEAKKNFEYIINNYPESEFATDSEYKLELINEILASKEMYIAKFYMEKEKWIPSINRFKKVVKDYDKSIYVEEALFRLVEIHYRIGLEDEAKKYAHLLGYNYQSSQWYENSYRIFNQKFKKKRIIEKNKSKSILEKIKSLL
jgi:outer membrane protein assembly factor BamD